jgi:hypothetical protein
MPVDALAEARAAGVIVYGTIAELDESGYSQIDAGIRDACRRINESGWVWTTESCSGHPDAAGPMEAWAGNPKPMLRLLTRGDEALGRALALLVAAGFVDADFDEGIPSRTSALELWSDDPKGEWRSVLVYIPARTVWERDCGLRVFERFAEAANEVASP